MQRLVAVFFACCFLASVSSATATQGLTGTWSGMLDFKGGPLLFVITITGTTNNLSATAASPYQGSGNIAIDSIALANDTLTFAIPKLDVSFTGKVLRDAISGTFSQHGTSVPLILTPSAIGTRDLAGTWIGILNASGEKLLLALHVHDGAAGSLSGALDIPSQQAFAMPVAINRAHDALTFTISSLNVSYEGRITADAIVGTFAQNGLRLPLTLTRPGVTLAAEPNVPAPYPTASPHFTSREISFESSGGAALAGTMTVPDGAQTRLPAFVFVHGSGAGTRDGGVRQNPTFLDLSNALSNAGVVVLRYDKRGIGASTGTATEDWHVLGDDVRSAVAFLRKQQAVDPNRIFLLGHSEGGIIVPLVAPSIQGLAGIVLLAPPAIPMEDIISEQSARMSFGMRQAVVKGLASYLGIDPAAVIGHVDVPILILQGGRDMQVLPSDLHHLTDAAKVTHRRVTVDLLPEDDHLFLAIPETHPDDFSEYWTAAPLDARVSQAILAWIAQVLP